jgi:MFS transporter, PPP family, 3-phenylpropionic acid transporter
MRAVPQAKYIEAKQFATRLALFYAALFIGFGLHQPFFPVWLRAKGLSDGEVGLVLASAMMVRLIATPVVTYFADRSGVLSKAVVVCASATMVAYVGVGLAEGIGLILISVLIAHFVWSPLMPLSDAYGLAGVARRSLDYGRIRVWGSVAFMAANIVGGTLLMVVAPAHIVWMICLSFVPLVAASVGLVPDRREPSAGPKGPGYFNGRFVLVTMAAAVLQSSHAVYYSFSAIHWKENLGYSGAVVGLLWAVAVGSEILMFWLGGRFTRGWRPTTYMIVGAFCSILRWVLMALDPPLAILAPLQVLHAGGFGLIHLGTMAYLADRLPPHARASGQGTVSIAMGFTMAGATLLAGYFFARNGAGAYFAMAALCVGGLGLTLAARSLPRPPVFHPQRDGAGG